jgi:hypothetical protein
MSFFSFSSKKFYDTKTNNCDIKNVVFVCQVTNEIARGHRLSHPTEQLLKVSLVAFIGMRMAESVGEHQRAAQFQLALDQLDEIGKYHPISLEVLKN